MKLEEAKQQFIDTWGALGSEWGINKSVAQVHALLLSSSNPISTDEIMESLVISRGNANMSIRQLIDYGIVYKKHIAGDRKEYFVAEKDVLKWAMKIAIMRKKKELDPVMDILKELSVATANEKSDDGKEFHNTVKEIQELTDQLEKIANKVFASNRADLLIKLFKFII
ncbi:DNA-binding transcriptional regulator GbsR (MarR family) [Sphingobacterium alimentarium]|jgi:DNA-binding transcriptional regulator GbsR (MarR family)|uniref:HTH-type transcriptional regulator n=1 Tax=Sphingobacterium alimentarium TaxID=797292 RepID=A0A4R3VX45_9SPHI|nr:transcriptional regulator [Sphingobacterium alimentarium]TCV12249.1 DNA-binding transcriptional regulator GbsR (MarR family) [Sphingobacterium alimentarium]